jgi:hypothetical protein
MRDIDDIKAKLGHRNLKIEVTLVSNSWLDEPSKVGKGREVIEDIKNGMNIDLPR